MTVDVKTTVKGDGRTYAKKGDTVLVHYTGTLEDGTVFDSSYVRGDQPFATPIGVGKVIPAWDNALLKMSVGEKAVLMTTSDYAYGARGAPPVIPPYATLRFSIHLIKILSPYDSD